MRKQRFKIGDTRSDWLNPTEGLPQGSLLGPFLFNIFSNELLLLLVNKCYVLNYADDTSIVCVIKLYDIALE